MSEKDFAGKLAAGIRRAKQSPTPRAAPPADTVRGGSGVKERYARQNDQSPPPSIDCTWADLHPERIWPD